MSWDTSSVLPRYVYRNILRVYGSHGDNHEFLTYLVLDPGSAFDFDGQGTNLDRHLSANGTIHLRIGCPVYLP